MKESAPLIAGTLNVALRPEKLSELYGQESLVASIRKHMSKRPPRTWMFTGPSGCGKTTVARIMALSYQCFAEKHAGAGEWGDPCPQCIASRANYTIHEINASDVNGVEELGKVAELARFRPVSSPYRVFILDEFHRASSAAQNLLLKPFEEPPAFTVWIIATTEPNKLLPTLRRRCVTYNLKPLGDAAEKFLTVTAKRIGLTQPLKPLIEETERLGISSPGVLLMALEKYAAGASATEAASGTDGGTIDTYRACKAITAGDWLALKVVLKDAQPEQSRWIMASVSGWLRGCLMRETDKTRQVGLALSLIELNGNAPLEDARLLPWLIGVLHKICRRF